MKTKQVKNKVSNSKSIDSIVAKVSGATQVAGVAVSETMTIKDEALDKISELKKQSTSEEGNKAIKRIASVTANLKK